MRKVINIFGELFSENYVRRRMSSRAPAVRGAPRMSAAKGGRSDPRERETPLFFFRLLCRLFFFRLFFVLDVRKADEQGDHADECR